MRLLFYLDNIIGIKDFAYFCGVKQAIMETITLRYEAGGAFANALAAFLANNEGFVMEKKTTAKRKRKTNYEITLEALKEAREGKVTHYKDFEDFKKKIHAL